MSDLVFILHKPTGHAYPISAATVDPDVHEVLADEPATLAGGQPRGPVYNYAKHRAQAATAVETEEAPKPATPRQGKPTDTKEK